VKTRPAAPGLWKSSTARSSDRGCAMRAPEVPSGSATNGQGATSTPWPKISVVIPALNEARNLPHVFSRLPAELHEVILVDGHSADDTLMTAQRLRPDVRIILQTRKGKGNALACGFAAATGDVIVTLDADGSADPGEIPQFVQALLDGADFAKGTRFAKGGGSSDITRLRHLGNRMLSTLVNVRYGTRYSDLCYGFNVFWRRHLPALRLDATTPRSGKGRDELWGDGFEIETMIHVRVAAAGLVVTEVPSFEYSRIHGASNLNAFSDGLRVLRVILSECRNSPRVLVHLEPRIWPGAAPTPTGLSAGIGAFDAALAPSDIAAGVQYQA
jgi:glycosyltransferase involved in cell wall biosynthesis